MEGVGRATQPQTDANISSQRHKNQDVQLNTMWLPGARMSGQQAMPRATSHLTSFASLP